jgi:hypothetical protein
MNIARLEAAKTSDLVKVTKENCLSNLFVKKSGIGLWLAGLDQAEVAVDRATAS